MDRRDLVSMTNDFLATIFRTSSFVFWRGTYSAGAAQQAESNAALVSRGSTAAAACVHVANGVCIAGIGTHA